MPASPMLNAISQITVGVADMAPVRALWIEHFGLEQVAARDGPDAGLAKLWGIGPDRIARQLLLRTPGADSGWLHFVQFNDPEPPVRLGAASTDLGPKNLDVNCHDMPDRFKALQEDGYRFRSDINEYRVGDIHAREVQMPGHDETNVVLVEVLSDGWEIEFTPQGFGAVTSFVVVVPDTVPEAAFYRDVLGLDEVMHHRITGPAIEKVVGLPPGAALDMRIMGREGFIFGRMELVSYEELTGVDRFPLAHAPALGTLHCGFAVDSVADTVGRIRAAGHAVQTHPAVETLYGSGDMAVVHSPAGFRLEFYRRDSTG